MDTPGLPQLFTNQQAASQMYPLQSLCDFANAVLDNTIASFSFNSHPELPKI
jgi:hypothetical protein